MKEPKASLIGFNIFVFKVTPTGFVVPWDSPSPFGIKMVDRINGKPLHIDISDLPMMKGATTNRNKFVLGPSGRSGSAIFIQT